jgi:hypothetical protein
MSRLRPTARRTVHLLLALLALLCGTGLHEALLELGGAQPGAPHQTAPIEAHDSSCPHRGDAPLHDHQSCVICKSGGLQHAVLPQSSAQAAPPDAVRFLPLAVDAYALAAPIPGSIGARAPPVTVG